MRRGTRRIGPGLTAALAAAAALAVLAGCWGGSGAADSALEGRNRVPLARLLVENRTERTLDVAFRYAIGPGGPVVVGTVPAGELREMAPVPALEPIVLVATGTGFRRELEPRTFEIDEAWSWVIRTDSMSHEH